MWKMRFFFVKIFTILCKVCKDYDKTQVIPEYGCYRSQSFAL